MSDNTPEGLNLEPGKQASLGQLLIAARQRRGLSGETVIKETGIPAYYVRMLESDDYTRISDQLYLLPFLRKYANFLGLDQDQAAMRFVREVQEAENNPPPVRMVEPLEARRRGKRRNWSGPLMIGSLLVVIVAAYILESHRRDAGWSAPDVSASSAPTIAAGSNTATANSFSAAKTVAVSSSPLAQQSVSPPIVVARPRASTVPIRSHAMQH